MIQTHHIQHNVNNQKPGARKYGRRALHQIKRIVIHHSASNTDVYNIARFHIITRKWPGIAYHFVINEEGVIYHTQDLTTISYHNARKNTVSLGICLIGNFEKQKPTPEQIEALHHLIESLRVTLGDLPIVGHRDEKATLCPGDNLYRLIKRL